MSDYNFLMESRLSPEQFAVLTLVSRLAAEHGQSLYLVGGAVRDLTFGQQVVRDLDFLVEGSPQRMLRAMPAADSSKAARGNRDHGSEPSLVLEYREFDEHFNSAELVFSNGVRAELSMCREEVHRHSGQRPEVRPTGIFEDLKRRDFAINAMAVSLHPNSRGLLLDPTNGAGDIERREIRALQSRCFIDDPSRIYRLLRLGIRLDFKTDERTQRWLDTALEDGAWDRLDSNQQARELAAILREDQPDRVLKLLTDRKLIGGLDKKLTSTHLAYDRFARIRNVLQNAPGADPFLLNFHCLVEKMGGEHKNRLAKKIIRETKTIKLALGIEQDAKRLDHALAGEKAGVPSQVYNILSPQPRPLLFYVLASTKSAKVQNRIKNFLFKFPDIRAKLPRTELQAIGVKPGPEFERIISSIFAMELDGKIKSHQQLTKVMRELSGIKEPPPPPPPPPVPALKKGKGKGAAAVPLAPPTHKGKPPAAVPVAVPHPAPVKTGSVWGRPKTKPAKPPAKLPAKPVVKSRPAKKSAPAKKKKR